MTFLTRHGAALWVGALFTGVLLTGVPTQAKPAASPASASSPDQNDARGWLMRMHEAASRRNFQGTFVVSSAGRVSSSRIAHFFEGQEQFERIEALDGERRQVFRHNNVVHTFWPARRVALIERRDALNAFPRLLQAGNDRLSESYELSMAGVDRVAGLDADVLQLKPRDALRYGYRLWTEKDSGLLLRAEVVDAQGKVLESSAFSEVTIGIKPQIDTVLKPMQQLGGWRVVRSQEQPTRLDAEGWVLKHPVAGFRSVDCVKRALPVTAADPELNDDASVPAVQTIYSDGLTYVSIFIEPYNPQRHAKPVETVIGTTRTLMRRHGDSWITVVGDVPAATLRQFSAALERK